MAGAEKARPKLQPGAQKPKTSRYDAALNIPEGPERTIRERRVTRSRSPIKASFCEGKCTPKERAKTPATRGYLEKRQRVSGRRPSWTRRRSAPRAARARMRRRSEMIEARKRVTTTRLPEPPPETGRCENRSTPRNSRRSSLHPAI